MFVREMSKLAAENHQKCYNDIQTAVITVT